MERRLRWGIVGTGRIAAAFARGLTRSRTGHLVAVGSRTRSGADAFGDRHGVPARHGSYDALLADDQVQAVYIATPHPAHAELAIRAAEAGKHILCEKPIALNHAQAMAVVEAAAENDVSGPGWPAGASATTWSSSTRALTRPTAIRTA
jgi:predicted dehydrogenase